MGTLLSSHDLTAAQREMYRGTIPLDAIGYALLTEDGRRIGVVDDVLLDDEDFTANFLVVDTATAEFIANQAHVLLPAALCCWDAERKTAHSRATAGQVQSAPAYDRAVALTRAYEETVFFNYGERPSGPADH